MQIFSPSLSFLSVHAQFLFFLEKSTLKAQKPQMYHLYFENFQISIWVHKNKIRKDNKWCFVSVHSFVYFSVFCFLWDVRKKWICTNLLFVNTSQIYKYWGANIWQTCGECHICLVIYTRCFLVCKCKFTIFAIYYFSVFTHLGHICKEKICANPLFRPVLVHVS